MEMKQPKLVRSRLEVAVAAFVAVASIAVGSAVLAQDSSVKPSTPPVADKPSVSDKMSMGADGGGMMGMGTGGSGMKGMMQGMQQMKCCGQGMGQADHGANDKQDEKK
jgi:hypothetical protein